MDAIITSMTPKERAKPEMLHAKRKIRVAKGSGTTVQDVNKLLKMHQEMATAMKKMQEDGRPGDDGGMFGKGGGRSRRDDGRRGASVRRPAWDAGPARRRRRPAGPSPRLPEFPEETLISNDHTNKEGRIYVRFHPSAAPRRQEAPVLQDRRRQLALAIR